MSEPSDHLESLAVLAHADGGWGYAPGQAAHLEPTCLALLALSAEAPRFRAAIDAGKAWLTQCACSDGLTAWPAAGPRRSGRRRWCCSCRRRSNTRLKKLIAPRAALLGARPAGRDDRRPGNQRHRSPLSRVAVGREHIFMGRADRLGVPGAAAGRSGRTSRVREGQKLLLDRALEEGGVNYGNRRIFGVSLEAIPGPTAAMLLALQGRPADPRVAAAVEFLRRQADDGEDLEHLCWARLALDIYSDHAGVAEACPVWTPHPRRPRRPRRNAWVRPGPAPAGADRPGTERRPSNPFRLAGAGYGRGCPPLLDPTPARRQLRCRWASASAPASRDC